MGYALFTNRKIQLSNLIFTLQCQLDNIMTQRQYLLNFSSNISDGIVTVEEMASDPTNFNNYNEYLYGAQACIDTPDDEGGMGTTIGGIGDYAATVNNSDEYLASIANMINQPVCEAYAKQCSDKLNALDNQLDMQQKRIESKISALQTQLQSVEDAEGKAIEAATPHFSGLC